MRWIPPSKKQAAAMTWWMSDKDYEGIIADGSIRAGKTLALSVGFVAWAMHSFTDSNFAICGKTVTSCLRNVIMPLIDALKGQFQMSYKYTEHCLNIGNNRFYVFGGKDESSQSLIQGITLAGVLLDEVALMPESFVNQATGRCSVEGSKFWFNCNPDSPRHWFNEKWIKNARERKLLRLHFTMDDNPALGERIKARYRAMYTGVFYRRFILGLWSAADGLIYDSFDEQVHTYSELPYSVLEQQRYISIDYGTTNPTVFLEILDDGDTARVNSEYYYSSKEHGRQKTDSEYADDFAKFAGSPEDVVCVIIDPSAGSLKVELRNRGYYLKNADNDVRNGISKTSTMFALGKLLVNKSCRFTINELLSYAWDKKASERGDEKPVKAYDHACDALRYAISTVIYTDWRYLQ